jgi:hypothetical protein
MRFIKLPFRLYRGQPNWVPPLIFERKRHLSRKRNPFFEHAEAEYFLAWRDGRVVGRISAHVDHRLNEFQQNDWGLFGFFECEDDQEAADALFRTAEDWNRERGRDRIVGPFDFSTNHECGLLVEGHELSRRSWSSGTTRTTSGSSKATGLPRRWTSTSGTSRSPTARRSFR